MRVRHDMIQERVKEEIIKHREIAEDEIRWNSRVEVNGKFGLGGFG
jgi:hypothetical protein